MAATVMNEDLKIILAHLQPLFKRRYNTRYWLLVANDPYDHTYNFFFNQQPKGHRKKSTPLHTVHGDLSQFEKLIQALQQERPFTIEYTGFAGLRWPSSGRLIERRKNVAE